MLKYKKTPEAIQQDMADWMNKDKSAILRMTDILEKKEMVKRMSVPGDRRKNIVKLTKKGEAVLKNFLKIESKITGKLKKNISKADYNTMVKVMMQIQKNASD
ncbi:MAG: MarR family transcriptional regulator [Bacteroidia bacterium]|nr:MarR family transcriptional regulator [Bacteroidia bacterium]